MPLPRLRVLAALLALGTTLPAHEHNQAALAQTMAEAAGAFLALLSEDDLKDAQFAADSAERENWHFVPMVRQGLVIKSMNFKQRAAALGLLHTALSNTGSVKVASIMQLEKVLRELENGAPHRDPDLYYLAIFGEPGVMPWGWRFEGHHVSVNQTITAEGISGTPLFLGANPGRVPRGSQEGKRILGEEEDMGRAFVLSLSAAQRKTAIISSRAEHEIETAQESRVSRLSPVGLRYRDMTTAQQGDLRKLLDLYVERHARDISEASLAKIEANGMDNLVFAWAGPTAVGEGHYYRIQGPTFVIEYGNTQNDANHHHTVFRDFENDFGRDVLGDHYRASH
ncbi:DUF3500 domain-containing protein [Synoicihabitans lomoniglobus]|uniref:DUF3500 domain-containing protein n=1 Tax=Synoicihabitans lomoniglobus TaxID=2909285 RepID=A0AAF0CML0_9BACT|nr:DUF3500 domain-containing protein [Opitutaceae bacterium LMO-M01]WED63426.1 DUF3500 domain-containing protein [Opitutaceae bacterium LMO-M01]